MMTFTPNSLAKYVKKRAGLLSDNLLTKWWRRLIADFFFLFILLSVEMFMASRGCLEKYVTPFNLHHSGETRNSGVGKKRAFKCCSNSVLSVL